jgi:hypothetical protein
VAKLDNPAGRLHELLRDYLYHATEAPNVSIISTWAAVFGAGTQERALLHLSEAAALVPQIELAVERQGSESHRALLTHYADDWLAGVTFPRLDIYNTQASVGVVELAPLAVLDSVSTYLSLTDSEGVVPDATQVADLRQQVQGLIDGILEDPALPEDIKRAALRHAHRLAEALDHVRVGGPGAVKAAAETLVGSLVMASPDVRQHGVWKNLLTLAGMAWTAFTIGGPLTQQALESWEAVVKMLPGGQ